ncbi:MAG: hypothetical protein LUG94_05800 [Ruminococcus sp.]|nr:hypothetical protein [Ruminococcus sp.]
MKNFKKIIAGVLGTVLVGSCLTLLPVSADVVLNDVEYTIYDEERMEVYSSLGFDLSSNVHTYTLPDDFDIQDVIDDENHTLVINGNTIVLTSATVESISILTDSEILDYTQDEVPEIQMDEDDIMGIRYTFNEESGEFCNSWEYSDVSKVLTRSTDFLVGSADPSVNQDDDDDVTIGESEDSITAFTIGDSVYPRGDINLDGKTNTADLLYLKKYLLGLIEW